MISDNDGMIEIIIEVETQYRIVNQKSTVCLMDLESITQTISEPATLLGYILCA